MSSAGAKPQQWDWWVHGWSASPAPGLPSKVKGFAGYGKKSWMTETSGEKSSWLSPANGFPGHGAWSIALKIEQALTAGRESAWIYWQMSDGKTVGAETLTDSTRQGNSPKYIAAKHFFRFIRPGAVRVDTTVSGSTGLAASAYVHDADGTLVVELVNTAPGGVTASIKVPAYPADLVDFNVVTSSNGKLWKTSTLSASGGKLSVGVPGYGVTTLRGHGVGKGGTGTVGNGGRTGTGGGTGQGGTSGNSGTGQGGAGQGGSGANSASGGTGNTGAASAEKNSGCGCRTAGGSSNSKPAFALLGLALFGLRRRRRAA